jgi:hypothetical protein
LCLRNREAQKESANIKAVLNTLPEPTMKKIQPSFTALTLAIAATVATTTAQAATPPYHVDEGILAA